MYIYGVATRYLIDCSFNAAPCYENVIILDLWWKEKKLIQ